MIQLLKNIQGEILPSINGQVPIFSTIKAEIGFEDYIDVYRFKAYLQNFKQATSVYYFEKPQIFGLKNQYNLQITILDISY